MRCGKRAQRDKTGISLLAFVAAIIVTAVCLLPCKQVYVFWSPSVADAQEDWKQDFEDVCSRTEDAMSLRTEELMGLVEKCDRLRPRIEKLEGAARKVYLKRLQLCRDLFFFVLESRQKK